MESGQGWDFNAPQFIDFTKPVEDENVDQYFGNYLSVKIFPHPPKQMTKYALFWF